MIKELVVKIKTIFEGDGGQAAIKPAKDLTEQTKKLNEATDDAAKKARSYADEQRRQIQIASQLTAASMGSREGIAGLAKELAKTSAEGTGQLSALQRGMLAFSNVVAKAGLVVTAFFAGWNVGSKIGDWLWSIATKVKDLGEPVRKTKAEFDALNEAKLGKLKIELDKIVSGLNDTIAALDKAEARAGSERSARRDAEIAGVEADTPAGPERESKIASIRKRYAEEEVSATIKASEGKATLFEQTARQAELRKFQMKQDVQAAESHLAEIDSRIAQRGSNVSVTLLKMRREAESGVTSARESYDKYSPDVDRQIISGRESLADEKSKQTVARLQSSSVKSEYQSTMSEIEKKRRKAASEVAAEKRRVERAKIEARIESASPEEARRLSYRLTDLDVGDLSAAAGESPAKKAVLEGDVTLAKTQRERELRARFAPQAEKLQGLQSKAVMESLEAQSARANMQEHPRDKTARATFEKESKEARQAQAEFEKAMKAYTSSHQDTLDEIVKFLQAAQQKNAQIKNTISRLPL